MLFLRLDVSAYPRVEVGVYRKTALGYALLLITGIYASYHKQNQNLKKKITGVDPHSVFAPVYYIRLHLVSLATKLLQTKYFFDSRF